MDEKRLDEIEAWLKYPPGPNGITPREVGYLIAEVRRFRAAALTTIAKVPAQARIASATVTLEPQPFVPGSCHGGIGPHDDSCP